MAATKHGARGGGDTAAQAAKTLTRPPPLPPTRTTPPPAPSAPPATAPAPSPAPAPAGRTATPGARPAAGRRGPRATTAVGGGGRCPWRGGCTWSGRRRRTSGGESIGRDVRAGYRGAVVSCVCPSPSSVTRTVPPHPPPLPSLVFPCTTTTNVFIGRCPSFQLFCFLALCVSPSRLSFPIL